MVAFVSVRRRVDSQSSSWENDGGGGRGTYPPNTYAGLHLRSFLVVAALAANPDPTRPNPTQGSKGP